MSLAILLCHSTSLWCVFISSWGKMLSWLDYGSKSFLMSCHNMHGHWSFMKQNHLDANRRTLAMAQASTFWMFRISVVDSYPVGSNHSFTDGKKYWLWNAIAVLYIKLTKWIFYTLMVCAKTNLSSKFMTCKNVCRQVSGG